MSVPDTALSEQSGLSLYLLESASPVSTMAFRTETGYRPRHACNRLPFPSFGIPPSLRATGRLIADVRTAADNNHIAPLAGSVLWPASADM